MQYVLFNVFVKCFSTLKTMLIHAFIEIVTVHSVIIFLYEGQSNEYDYFSKIKNNIYLLLNRYLKEELF